MQTDNSDVAAMQHEIAWLRGLVRRADVLFALVPLQPGHRSNQTWIDAVARWRENAGGIDDTPTNP